MNLVFLDLGCKSYFSVVLMRWRTCYFVLFVNGVR